MLEYLIQNVNKIAAIGVSKRLMSKEQSILEITFDIFGNLLELSNCNILHGLNKQNNTSATLKLKNFPSFFIVLFSASVGRNGTIKVSTSIELISKKVITTSTLFTPNLNEG